MTKANDSALAQRERVRKNPMGDEAAEAALVFLSEYAVRAGQAKAAAMYMENYRQVVLANLKRKAPAECKSDAARDEWARCQQEYLDQLAAQREAVEEDTKLHWKRIAAEATIEAWRTKNANNRGAGRLS